jgi:hypothetical protein
VTGGENRRNAVLRKHAPGSDADGQDGGLGILGEAQIFLRTIEEDAAEGKAQCFIRFGKGGRGYRKRFGQCAAHAHRL